MRYVFYSLVAIVAIWFLRYLIKALRLDNKIDSLAQNTQQKLSSFISASIPLLDGRVNPNVLFPVFDLKHSLTALEICIGERIMVAQSKKSLYFRNQQISVPSLSFLFYTDDKSEILLTVVGYHECSLLAKTFLQALNNPGIKIVGKYPLEIAAQSRTLNFSESLRDDTCKVCYSENSLAIEFLSGVSLFVLLDIDKKETIEKVISELI